MRILDFSRRLLQWWSRITRSKKAPSGNETYGRIWTWDLTAVKFGSSSAHFRDIWKISIPSGEFELFQNRSEIRSDEMFGSSQLFCDGKKTIYFEKFDFRLFWKISDSRLHIAAQRGFWCFNWFLALWKCYKYELKKCRKSTIFYFSKKQT